MLKMYKSRKKLFLNYVPWVYTERRQCESPCLVNFVLDVAYHLCLALPAAFTQPGTHLLACTSCPPIPGEAENVQRERGPKPNQGAIALAMRANEQPTPTAPSLPLARGVTGTDCAHSAERSLYQLEGNGPVVRAGRQ